MSDKINSTPNPRSVNIHNQFANCPECHGTGNCATCDGYGFLPNGNELEECPDCNGGSGECQRCDGTGHVPGSRQVSR